LWLADKIGKLTVVEDARLVLDVELHSTRWTKLAVTYSHPVLQEMATREDIKHNNSNDPKQR